MSFGPWMGDGKLEIDGQAYPVSYEIRFRVERGRHVFEGVIEGLPTKFIGEPPQDDRLALTLANGDIARVAVWPATGKIVVNEPMPGFG